MLKDERVLILYSWNDSFSEQRLWRMQESPLVDGITLEHCFAMEHEDEDITSDTLVQRVTDYVQSFRPTVFLLHTGAAFQSNKDVFLNALPVLKERFKDLRFGCERWHGELDEALAMEGVFDNSPAVRELEALFFMRVFGIA